MKTKFIAVLILLGMLTISLCGCKAGSDKPAPSEMAKPTEAAVPTETEAAQTASPIDNLPDWLTRVDESNYSEQLAAAKSILRGETPEPIWKGAGNGFYFDLETDYSGSYLTAYNLCISVEETYAHGLSPSQLYFFGAKPIRRYPFELAELAEASLYGYLEEYWPNDITVREGPIYLLPGFCGEDWIVVHTVTDSRFQVHTIFRTDDGNSWYEFGSANSIKNGFSEITGACILSKTDGVICMHSSSFDDGLYERAFITRDSGTSWTDLNLTLPGEYSGCVLSVLFCPMFDGDHGVILANAYYNEINEDNTVTNVFGWFETRDLGASWEFHTLAKADL